MNKRALQDTNETVIEKIQIYSEDEPLRKEVRSRMNRLGHYEEANPAYVVYLLLVIHTHCEKEGQYIANKYPERIIWSYELNVTHSNACMPNFPIRFPIIQVSRLLIS